MPARSETCGACARAMTRRGVAPPRSHECCNGSVRSGGITDPATEVGMKRSTWAAVLLVAAGCGETTAPDLRLDPQVRVVHAAPETPRLQVVLEGDARTRLDYAEVSDLFTLPTGERR